MKKKKPRNLGTMTEAAYWGKVRSTLRRAFRFWKPITEAKLRARRKYTGDNKRQKWEYQCASCKQWHKGLNIQVDHIVPVGTLKCKEDLSEFMTKLTPETGFQVLCKPCHQVKTNEERSNGG